MADNSLPDENTADDSPATEGERDEWTTPEAATYAVLSRCWREPTPNLVATVNRGALDGVLPGVTDVDAGTLQVEYSRLLVGPGEQQVPPYESVYRDAEPGSERGPVRGPSTRAVEKWYRSYGVEPAADWNDMPDHVATELEFLSYLSENGHQEARDQFLEEHVHRWIDEFLDAVRAETTHPYYEALVQTTREVLSDGPA
jgi:TorA maturation chaperone TorD